MNVEGKTGIQSLTDGTYSQLRLDKSGALVVDDRSGHFYETNYRAHLFSATTAVTGVAAQGAAALAATCAFALRNPTGSGVNAVIFKAMVGYVSGTQGVGTYVWAQYAQGAAALGGTAVTPVSAQAGNVVSSQCTAGTGASVVAGTPTLLRGTGITQGAFVGGAVQSPTQVEFVDGDIIVPPGIALVLFLIGAAGTSEKNIYTLTWAEEPV